MKLSAMRYIDFYIGRFLCASLTVVRYASFIIAPLRHVRSVLRKISGPASSGATQVLFIKLSEMGTTVFFPAVLDRLARHCPDHVINFLVFRENSFIVDFLKVAGSENIFTVRTDKGLLIFAYDLLRAIIRLRAKGMDVSIDFEFFSRITAIISFLIGGSVRIGYHRFHGEGLKRGNLYTHVLPYNPFHHTIQNYFDLVDAIVQQSGRVVLHDPVIDIHKIALPKMKIESYDRQAVFQKLRSINSRVTTKSKIVIFNPDTGELLPFRKWPEQYFIDLGNMLTRVRGKDVFIVITGVERSQEIGNRIAAGITKNVISLVGKTSFAELFALYAISHVLVTVDSGPAHFAALTEINVVCIFGPDTPIAFAPLTPTCVNLTCGLSCHPCYSVFNNRMENCGHIEKPCLISIKPDRVFEKVVKCFR